MDLLLLSSAGFLVGTHATWYLQWRLKFPKWKEERTLTTVEPLSYRANSVKLQVPTFSDYKETQPLTHPMVAIWRHLADHVRNDESCACFILPVLLVVGLVGTGIFLYINR